MCIVQKNKCKTIPSPAGAEDQGEIGGPYTALPLSCELSWAARLSPCSGWPGRATGAWPRGPPSCQQLSWCSNSFKTGCAQNQEENLQGKEAIRGMLPLDKKKLFSFHVTKTGISLAAKNV